MLNSIKFLVLLITSLVVSSFYLLESNQVGLLKNKRQDTIQVWATYYYIPSVKHSDQGIDLLDKNETPLRIKLDSCDWCTACIEGTISVFKDSTFTLFNYAGRSNKLQYDCRACSKYNNYTNYDKTGKVLWEKSKGYRKGVKNLNLVPYKTIAVDSSFIPYGTLLFIPDAVNEKYVVNKDTLTHDGYFFAGDTGSKIKGNHIDVFLGYQTSITPSFISSDHNILCSAIIIKDSIKIKELRTLSTF